MPSPACRWRTPARKIRRADVMHVTAIGEVVHVGSRAPGIQRDGWPFCRSTDHPVRIHPASIVCDRERGASRRYLDDDVVAYRVAPGLGLHHAGAVRGPI